MINPDTASVQHKKRIETTDLVMTGMFAALICVLSPFTIPTQPIPFTLALFTIFLTGAMLKPRFALLAVITYLLIGLCGIPVFSGFESGPQKLVGYTGGYLMSYPLMALIISLFNKYFKKYKVLALFCGMTTALLLCYLLGTLWFVHLTNNSLRSALLLCVVPYIPFDFVKIALAISLSFVIRRTLLRNRLGE